MFSVTTDRNWVNGTQGHLSTPIKESTNQDSKWIDAGQVNQSSMKVKICVSSEGSSNKVKNDILSCDIFTI